MNYTLFSVILGMLPGEWWMLNMYEHVRSAELLEPLENYTQNGNCPARFRRGNKKWLKKKHPPFQQFRQLSLMRLKPSPIHLVEVTKHQHGFFQGQHLDVKHSGEIFIHESLNVPENHHKTSKLKNQWVKSTPHWTFEIKPCYPQPKTFL